MKMEKIVIIFLMLLMLVITVGSVAASDLSDNISDNSTFSQENPLSQEDSSIIEDSDEIVVNDWTELRDYCSLNDKNYVLKLKENTNYYPDDPTSDEYQIVINNNVTIKGNSGAYIGDLSPNARAIKYAPMKVNDKSRIGITLEGITFKWINTNYQTDGVFLILGGNVNNTIKDCSFYNITTNMGHSSILHIKYGKLDINNCSFINCTTDYGCISVYCPSDNPTGICTGAKMDISDSYFEGNYAKTEPGCINNCGLLNVYNTTFYRNSAFWWAGAIHTHGGAKTTIYESNFTDNVAGWNGGALYTYSYLEIYNSTFTGNNCTTNNGGGAIGACRYLHSPYIYIVGCLFKDNENLCWGLSDMSTSGTGRGGAISFMNDGGLEVYNSTFIENSASIGTAICAIGGGQMGSPDVKIIGNKFINHTRIGDILVINLDASSSCDIRDNYYNNNSIEFSKLKLTANDPVDGKVTFVIDPVLKNSNSYDSDILEKSLYDVYVDGVYNCSVSSLVFTLDFQKGETHRVYIAPSISNSRSNEVLAGIARTYIYVSQKFGNDANDGLTRDTPVATLNQSIELARSHENIIIMDGTFSEKNLNIDYNLTIVGEGDVTVSSKGSVFKITDGEVIFKNINFNNNKLSVSGQTTSERLIKQDHDGILTITNCTFYNNDYGTLIESKGSVGFENLRFIKNNGALLKSDKTKIIDSVFDSNVAIKNSYETLLLYSTKTINFNMENCIFTNNNVQKGCIKVNSGNSLISYCNFTNNMGSSRGSCVFNEGSSILISSSVFINNKDTGSSSFIYANSGTTFIQESIILNNSNDNSINYINGANSGLKGVTCNHNWWGNTLDNLAKPNLDSEIKCDNWLVLNVTSSHELLGVGEIANIFFDLNYMVDSKNNVSIYYADKLPQFDFTVKSVNGICDSIVSLSNSRAVVNFELINFKNGSITATYMNVKVSVKFYATKIDPNFNIYVNDTLNGEDANITVTAFSKIESVEISVDGTSYTLNFVDGISNLSVPNLNIGTHNITIDYEETSLYYASHITRLFEVYAIEPEIYIDVNNTYYGNELNVTVHAPNDATGIVNITLGEINQSKQLTNGNAEFTFTNLDAKDYLITINYSGDKKYLSKENTANLTIFKYGSLTILSLSELVVDSDIILTAFIDTDATGNVTFIVNGESHVVNVSDAKASYVIQSIPRGDYNIQAIYNGDEKYLPSQNSTKFSVGKLDSNIKINVSDIKYGENATIEIILMPTATGNVTISVDGKSKSMELVDSKATVSVSGLSAGDKLVEVSYTGDNDYLPTHNSTSFKISKINPTFTVLASSIMVGNEATVIIDFNRNMTGNFTFNLGSESKTYSISKFGKVNPWRLENLKPGNYTVHVMYNGDNNYYSLDNSTSFEVCEYPKPQVSNDGIDTANTDKSPFEGIVNGNVIYSIEIGDKINGSIVIDSEENIYFTSNTTIFAYSSSGELIWKYNSSEIYDGSFSGVTIGRNILISPMSGNRLYFINITSGNENKHSNLKEGSSFFSPIIDENYNVYTVSEYQYSTNDYKLVIIPYSLWETSVTPTMISIGNSKPLHAPVVIDEEHVGVLCENGLKIVDISTGYVSSLKFVSPSVRPIVGLGATLYAFSENSIVAIVDEQQQWKTSVTGGIGKYLALDSDMGYIFSANAEGVLYRYDIGDGEETFIYDFKEEVTSNVLIDNEGILYLGTASGKFYSLDYEGNLLWKVNLAGQINGNPVLDQDGYIYVIVNESKVVKLGNGLLKDADLNTIINNINVGKNLTVFITFDNAITGNITVKINNAVYNVTSITNEDNMTLNISDLTSGDYNATIIYSGDLKFKSATQKIEFSVLKYDINIISSDLEIYEGSPAVFDLTLPSDANGDVSVIIDNQYYNGTISEGKVTIKVFDLSNGTYDVTVKFWGDKKYMENETSVLLVVLNKIIPNADDVISIPDSTTNQNPTYSINLTGATGNLTVKVDGNIYETVDLVNGSATIAVSDLPSGNHKIEIIYSGDDKYSHISKTTTFNVPEPVNPHVEIIKITSSDVSMLYTSGTLYSVRLTSDGQSLAGKTVKFIINGKKINTNTDKNGYASVKLDLPPKNTKYVVSATYGDVKVENYVKVNSILSAKNLKVKKSAKQLKIKVTLKKVNGKYLKSKKITLKLNGKKFTAKTNKKGVATVKITKNVIKKLKAGKKYTYQISYLKDTVKKTLKVKK